MIGIKVSYIIEVREELYMNNFDVMYGESNQQCFQELMNPTLFFTKFMPSRFQ
jgi:hypothetical protein